MSGMDYSMMKLPKLVAFDLDGTIWTPDMYQLWGGGAPFKHAPNGKDLLDKAGNPVRLLGISAEILHELKNNSALTHIKVAWVSCTDEPEWADECLRKFTTSGGQALSQIVDSSQIFKSNKQKHFQNLRRQYPDIGFEEMLFFDNEYGNIRNVSQLGVKCYYCEDGMTQQAWEEGLRMFR
jgi:magnesium-dependent phosphatase 1